MLDGTNEFAIEWYRGDSTVRITAPNASWLKNRLIRYAETYPDEVKILYHNTDGSIFAEAPESYVRRFARPREMTEEQKEAARERLAKWRERKNNSKNE